MNHTNYSKISTTPAEVEPVEEVDAALPVTHAVEETEGDMLETVTDESVAPPPEPMWGYVSGCKRLNVRKEPNINADIVCVIEKDAGVMVDESESTDTFYKVYTEAGADGYCMKDYIRFDKTAV